MVTRIPKIQDLEDRWLVIDAAGKTLGRLATYVATRLRGKHRPTFTPHMDTGDHVIVVNAGQIRVSGQKASQKLYRRHSGRPGGLKEIPFERMLERHPERVIELAVSGMLPKNSLGRKIFKKLKVYAGPEHPHQAQSPVVEELPGRA